MGGSWVWIVAVIAAVGGYLVGRARSRQVIPLAKKFTITVDKPGKYKSKTDPKEKHVEGCDVLEWKVQGHDLPKGAEVFLRFPVRSPLDPPEPADSGTRKIQATVLRDQPRGDYDYKVYYRLNGVDHLLEDPKLIIES